MQAESASLTALSTAYIRAAHQIIDSGPRILDDPIAVVLLGAEAEQRIRRAASKYMSYEAKALRAHVLLRSRYTEVRLESSIPRGVRQYVLIGAGFDTFALRQPEWASNLSIIEVDHPDTQRLKQSKILDSGLGVPDNVTFAAVNFEQESLEDGLSKNGVRCNTPTFFSWLGVTMYLTESAIDSTLKCMAGFSAGSEAVITFLQKPQLSSAAGRQIAERVAEAGEPFVSYFTPHEFKKKLMASGFSKIHPLTTETSASYFREKESALANPKRVSIISALV